MRVRILEREEEHTLSSDDDNYKKYRGKCKEMSEKLCAADPSLRLVRGWYYDPHWGQQGHWWCVRTDGTIVDPTKDQFPSRGSGLYEEFDGWYECEQCGKMVHESAMVTCGNYPCCSDMCAMRLVGVY